MFRFLHTADWHLGASQYPSVYNRNILSRLVEIARQHKISNVIGVGDIFDKSHPNQQTKDELLKVIIDSSDIEWYFVVGNHDYTTKAKKYHSLKYLKIIESKVDNVSVCNPGINKFSDFYLVVLKDEHLNLKLPKIKGKKQDKPVILAWHGIFPGINIKDKSQIGTDQKVGKILKHWKADYFALGDIHKPIRLHERCWYSGSLVQKTYSCQSGILLVEIEKEKIGTRKLSLGLPRRITIKIDEKDVSENRLLKIVKDKIEPGNLVRMKFQLPLSTWLIMDTVALKQKLLKYYAEVKLVNRPIIIEKELKSSIRKVKVLNLNEEIDRAIDKYKSECGLDKEKLRKICKGYISDVERKEREL